MPKQLLIRLLDQTPASSAGPGTVQASWVQRDDNRLGGRVFFGSLRDAAAQADGAQVLVLVPGAEVLLAAVELPPLKGQKLARAASFALEEQLAGDVEDLHVAIGSRDATGRLTNAVVSRARLDAWLRELREAGLQPDVVSPEVFGVSLDAGAGQWSLVVDVRRAMLRTGEQLGLVFEPGNLQAVVNAALAGAGSDKPEQLEVTLCESADDGEFTLDPEAVRAQLGAVCAQHGVRLAVHDTTTDSSAMLASGFDERRAINLLQGDYSRTGQLGKRLRPWRVAAILAAVWILVQGGLLLGDYLRLARQQEQNAAQITAQFQEAFPDKRLVPGQERLLMERSLAELRGGSVGGPGFLHLLARAGAVLKSEAGVDIRSVRYKENTLDMDINLPDLQVLDRLKQQLAAGGLTVEIVSASSRDGKVQSRLNLAASTPAAGGGQ